MILRKIYFYLVVAFVVSIFVSCGASSKIYVSPQGNDNNNGTKRHPYRSIEKTMVEVRAFRKTNQRRVEIHLLAGEYHLLKPILINEELHSLSIIGEGADKVSVKGSKLITTSWKVFDKNIWVAELDEDIDFDQVHINAVKQIRARYPNYDENGGYWQGSAADAISTERVKSWKNPIGGFLHVMHDGRWGDFHYQIAAVDSNYQLKFIGGHQNNRPSAMHPTYRMVENIFEELDSENEWFFDKENRKLYVWKPADVELNEAKVELSFLKNLVQIIGSTDKAVRHISIEGISFQHATMTFMESYEPLLRSDWKIYRAGAIVLENTEDCRIENCEFTDLGGNVIFANAYNRHLQVVRNHIHHCGASAISFVGDASAVRSPSFQYSQFVQRDEMDTLQGPKNDLYPSECSAENNLIYKIGQVEKQVAAVQISMAMKILVKNNSIYDLPRAGINVSEGTWGGHIIEFNDVFNTVLESSDHGSFNSWGRDRFWHPDWNVVDKYVKQNPQMPYWDAMHTTIIRNNRFRCDHGWDIDLDDGSSNYHIYNNLCLNGGIKLREGYYRVVENNIMINNSFHPHVWFSNSEDVFRSNIVTSKYYPIRLAAWGKEVDYNFFPDSASLALSQKNNTDSHSRFGDPMFEDATRGDYRIKKNSDAFKIGFKNFEMNQFGVQNPTLKAMARTPIIPVLRTLAGGNNNQIVSVWKGLTLKSIETVEEQSAFGMHSMEGVIVQEIAENSMFSKSKIALSDVIVAVDQERFKNLTELLIKLQEKHWQQNLQLTVVRNQVEIELEIDLD